MKLAPALGEDRTIQPALLRDAYAGLRERSLGRAGHVLDPQVLDHDQAVAGGQLGRELVQKVIADPGLAAAKPGDLIQRALVACRAPALTVGTVPAGGLLMPGLAPQPPQPFGLPGAKVGAVEQLAG